MLLSHASIGALARIASHNDASRHISSVAFCTRVVDHFADSISDIDGFMAMLGDTNSVVVGECLLPLFEWPNSNYTAADVPYIDICTPYRGFAEFIEYLELAKGTTPTSNNIPFQNSTPRHTASSAEALRDG